MEDFSKKPLPGLPLRILKWYCNPDFHPDIEGDLIELYEKRKLASGKRLASILVYLDVLFLFRPSIIRPFVLDIAPSLMKHNLRIGWWHIARAKGYSLIHVAGLTLALTVAMLIAIWVRDELSFDRFHHHNDRIYSVKRNVYMGDYIETSSTVTYNIAKGLSAYPEVAEVSTISQKWYLVFQNDQTTFRSWGYFATPEFLDMFSWNLIMGNPSEALHHPDQIVISSDLAEKYFGPEWRQTALGQTIQQNNPPELSGYRVAGIFDRIPENSSLQFDFLLTWQPYEDRNNWLHDWNNSGVQLFALLNEGVQAPELSTRITNMQNDHIEDFRSDLFLQAFNQEHLYNRFVDGKLAGGRIQYIQLFILIAIFLLLIASINYFNLTTARASSRSMEMGVRKAIGAERKHLFAQVYSESFLILLLSSLCALSLIITVLPTFNTITGKNLTLGGLRTGQTLALFAGITAGTALLAGVFPAIKMSLGSTIQTIKGTYHPAQKASKTRQVLVIFQFAVSMVLMVGAITIHRQLKYIQNNQQGSDRDNVVSLRLEGDLYNKYPAFKTELLRSPNITEVTSADNNPLFITSNTHSVQWPGKDPNVQLDFHVIYVDFDFLDVMKMQIIAGRDFDPNLPTDTFNCILNEAAVKVINPEDPLSMNLKFWEKAGKVVGVVKNFQMASLYSPISPTIIQLRPRATNWVLFRTVPGRTQQAVQDLKRVFKTFNPKYPLEYEFLNEQYMSTYRSELVMGKLSSIFSSMALFIAFLGLLGLAVFSNQQRLKEISIRKVMGASILELSILLSRDILVLVALAILIATPVSYLLVTHWLARFNFHTPVNPGLFILAGTFTFLISVGSVGYYIWKVAVINPIDALKQE
ncbi:MAG TPA: ABC transporter permease [Saprospiraceae bacterium]|nr:ABC transporter permease [Saprospiraceae bacterium]